MRRESSCDIETFCELDLPEVGLHRYVEHPSFEILMVTWRDPDTGELLQVDYRHPDQALEERFIRVLEDGTCKKLAHNAAFEYMCLKKWYPDIDLCPQDWECDMVRAQMCGLPAKLSEVALALGLPKEQQKATTGRSLISFFCGPCKPTKTNNDRLRNLPEHDMDRWKLFLAYNRQDVITEESVVACLREVPIDEKQFEFWSEHDLPINMFGVYVDMEMVSGAIAMSLEHRDRCLARSQELTKLENPNSLTQLKKWLSDETGDIVDTLDKESLPDYIKDAPTDTVAEVLTLRGELAGSSVKKYFAIERSVCKDGRIHGMHQFYGANRTGRWTQRLVQMHNLKKNGKDFDIGLARRLIKARDVESIEFFWGAVPAVLGEAIRSAFTPAPGNAYVPVDFKAVEARALAWAAWEEWVMDVFAGDGKLYEATAARMFGLPIEQITKAHPARDKGKKADLACGYQGAVGAMVRTGALEDGKIKEEELPGMVKAWRASRPKTVKLWYAMEDAAVACLRTRRPQTVAMGDPANPRPVRFTVESHGGRTWLAMWLQSGRPLLYFDPVLETTEKFGKQVSKVTYMGIDDKHRWVRMPTYGGKLVENWDQGFCRDLLFNLIKGIRNNGIDVAFHVHDEAVPEVPEGATKMTLELMNELAAITPDWAPGLVLEGDASIQHFYHKED